MGPGDFWGREETPGAFYGGEGAGEQGSPAPPAPPSARPLISKPSCAYLPRSAPPSTYFSLCAPSHAPRLRPGTSWGSRGSACPACVAVGVAGSKKSSSASELDMAPSGRRLSGSRPVTTTIPLALGSGRGFRQAGNRPGDTSVEHRLA